jgi:hypothetical protein
MVSRIIGLLVLILVAMSSLLMPIQASNPNYQEFTVETHDYQHEINSDALSIDYSLLDYSGKRLQQGSVKRNAQTKQLQKLRLEFPQDGVYDLFLTLQDDVENTARFQHRIFVDTADKSQGSLYGADGSNPWGKDQRYQDQAVNAKLLISAGTLGGGYQWQRFEIPPPLLTYSGHDGKSGELFGLALSKASRLNVQVWKKFPSYLEAEIFCAGRFAGPVLTGLRNHTDQRVVKCLESELGLSSLKHYYAWLESKCENLIPFLKVNCVLKHHRQAETRYFGIFSAQLEHIRVGIYRNSAEVAHFWQESEPKFRRKLNLPAGAALAAKVSVYGRIDILGTFYSYDGHASVSSNGMVLRQRPSSAAATICNNIACRTLNVEYFNQAVNPAGKWEKWPNWPSIAGGQSCGASSAVMALGQRGLLPKAHGLKSFVYQDNGLKLKNKRCNRGGAFAVTAADKYCNQSSQGTIQNLLAQFGVGTRKHTVTEANSPQVFADIIKPAIDRGKPLILSYSKPIQHVLLIIGYTYGGQIVVHDPYRDIQNNYIRGKYDYTGKGAIYGLKPNRKYVVNYLLETI